MMNQKQKKEELLRNNVIPDWLRKWLVYYTNVSIGAIFSFIFSIMLTGLVLRKWLGFSGTTTIVCSILIMIALSPMWRFVHFGEAIITKYENFLRKFIKS